MVAIDEFRKNFNAVYYKHTHETFALKNPVNHQLLLPNYQRTRKQGAHQ